MSLRTVGIEFQAKGERETVAAIGRVDSAQKKLASTSNALKSAVEREVTTAANAVRAYKLLRDAGMSYSDVLKGLDQNTKMLGQAHQAHINSLLGVDRSSKSARDSANVLAQAFRQQEAQVENASRSYNQLIASINPTVAAQQRIRQAHQTVRAALAAEIITRDEAAQALREYRAAAHGAAGGINFASRGLNRTGVVAQQAGYQVGDFFVQIQSGTNVMVAFGQQATQLVGTFAMFARTTRAAMIASGIGIFISMSTAIAAAFMRTRQSVEDATPPIERMRDALQSLDGVVPALESVDAGLENISDSARTTLDLFRQIAAEKLEAGLRDFIQASPITQQIRQIEEAVNTAFSAEAMSGVGRTFAEIEESMTSTVQVLGLNIDQARQFREMLYSISGDTTDEMAQSFADVVQRMTEAGLITDETRVIIEQMGNELGLVAALQENVNAEAEAQQQAMQAQLELSRQITEQENQRNARHAERIQDIQNEIRVMQLTLQYGEESVQVQTELNRQARARVVTEMMAAGHTAESIAAYIALVREAQELEETSRRTENLIQLMSGANMGNLVTQINNVAAAMGIAADQAARAVGGVRALAVLQAEGGSGRSAGPGGIIIGSENSFENYDTSEAEEFMRSFGSGGGGGGGGGGTSAFQSQIDGIRALQEAIAAAEEQAAMFNQEVDLLDSALQHGLITQQEYNTLLTQAQEAYGQAQTAAYDYQNAIEQISNTASSAMEDAFMSIVDGSATAADAFRNMAREILAEAFKMLVVRPIMNSLFGGGGGKGGGGFLGSLFGFENGGAFHAGRVIPFADGGVVSGPTMFPMRGNQTGLMGEAGPEAIMPLKRGRDGKLGVQAEGGGGQSIVIHQSFNFQANGDESVKRIIAQEAPKIANLTQQQIIDQRKRGGVMKATF